MAEGETPTTAFMVSLIAGILILLSGTMVLVTGTAIIGGLMGGYYPVMMGNYYPGMMGGYPGTTGFVSSVITGIGIWGIICGVIILYGATRLKSDPVSHVTWGIVIIIVSLVSLFEGGGFLIGAILGISGGILAITWKPSESPTEVKK
jgi:hypothetical protein